MLKSYPDWVSTALFVVLALSLCSQQKVGDTTHLKVFELHSDSIKGNQAPLESNSTGEWLETEPQVQLVRRGSFAWEPVINTYRGGQIAVTLNGMRVFGACTDKMDPATSYTDPSSLEAIEVDCHSGKLNTGSNVGGSLELQNTQAQLRAKQVVSGWLSSGVHSISQGGDVAGQLQLSKAKWAVKVSGAFRNRENYRDGNGDEVPYTQYRKYHWAVHVRHQLSSRWLIEFDYLQDQGRNIGYAGLPMDVSLAQADLFSLSGKWFPFGKWIESIEWKAYGNEVIHQMDDSNRPDEEVPIRMDMPGWSRTYGAYSLLEGKKWKRHKVNGRLEYYQNFRRAEMTMYAPGEEPMFMLTWPDVMRRVAGLSLMDSWSISKRDQLSIGFRYEHSISAIQDEFGHREWEIFGFDTDTTYVHQPWQVTLNWEKNWAVKWKTNLGGGFAQRLPSTTELFGYYLFSREDGYDYLGNPELELESAWKLFAQLERKTKHVQVSINAYYDYLEDYIYAQEDTLLQAMTVGANGVKTYDHIPVAHSTGITLQARANLGSAFQAHGQLSYVRAWKGDGGALPQIPPMNYSASLNWLSHRGWIAVEVLGALAQHNIDLNFGEDSTPAWAIMNISSTWKLVEGKRSVLEVTGEVKNLFNSWYYAHLDWGNVPRPGRDFGLQLKWKF